MFKMNCILGLVLLAQILLVPALKIENEDDDPNAILSSHLVLRSNGHKYILKPVYVKHIGPNVEDASMMDVVKLMLKRNNNEDTAPPFIYNSEENSDESVEPAVAYRPNGLKNAKTHIRLLNHYYGHRPLNQLDSAELNSDESDEPDMKPCFGPYCSTIGRSVDSLRPNKMKKVQNLALITEDGDDDSNAFLRSQIMIKSNGHKSHIMNPLYAKPVSRNVDDASSINVIKFMLNKNNDDYLSSAPPFIYYKNDSTSLTDPAIKARTLLSNMLKKRRAQFHVLNHFYGHRPINQDVISAPPFIYNSGVDSDESVDPTITYRPNGLNKAKTHIRVLNHYYGHRPLNQLDSAESDSDESDELDVKPCFGPYCSTSSRSVDSLRPNKVKKVQNLSDLLAQVIPRKLSAHLH